MDYCDFKLSVIDYVTVISQSDVLYFKLRNFGISVFYLCLTKRVSVKKHFALVKLGPDRVT